MWEVYSGTRPGKPARLLVLSAMLLASTLGLAWWQVSASRALAGEQRVGETSLIVRPPVGWFSDPQSPGRYVLPLAQHGLTRSITIERQVTFRYLRTPSFHTPREYVAERAKRDALPFGDLRPARIGRFAGLQATRRLRVEHRGMGFDQDSVLRVACTPRGDVIIVEYVPLTDLTLGDLDLLDAMCRAVRIDDPPLSQSAAAAWSHVGLAARVPADVCVVSARDEVAGLYLGYVTHGEMTHAIDVFRTWMAPGRTAAEILHDVAATSLRLPNVEIPQPSQTHRADGLNVAILRNPAFGMDESGFESAALVWRSPRDAVLLVAHADTTSAEAAERSLAQLCETIGFRESECAPDIDNAIANGTELAKLLTNNGPAAWWGREPKSEYLLGLWADGPRLHLLDRSAENRNPRLGYRGRDVALSRTGDESEQWILDESGREFTSTWQGLAADGTPTTIRVERADKGDIRLGIQYGRMNQAVKLTPNDYFVAPPLDFVAQAWVALQEDGEWLLETVGTWGQSLPTELLQPLAPDDAGRRRVVIQLDYAPYGWIITFNADQSIYSAESPAGRLNAVSRSQAERAIPLLRNYSGQR